LSKEPPPSGAFQNLFKETERAPSGLSSFLKLFTEPEPPDAPQPEESPSCALRFEEKSVFWAMRNLPVEEAPKHFLVCGTTGSGKTKTIQLLLQSIAPRFTLGRDHPEQLIMFDAKCDVIPLLAALDLRPEDDNVFILNPHDARSAVWKLGEAVQMPVMARALASLLIPAEPNSNAPFWADAARELVYAATIALNSIDGSKWSLRDLLCALDSVEHIKAVTAREPSAARLAAQFLGDEHHVPGVLSTVASKLGRFGQVAALWDSNTSKRRFSIPEFLSRPGVLVLGNDPVLRESIWPLNAILLKALVNEILRGPDTLQPRHWFVLDEFKAMERVDCIHDLLNRGRSKGASVLLGIQNVEGLIEIYGEHGTNDILSLCSNKMFLRAGGPVTAEWAERFFSKVRHMESVVTESTGASGSSTAVARSLHERSLFLASFFLDLPFPGMGEPYVAVCDVPSLKQTLVVRREFDDVLSWCKPSGSVPNVVPRTDAKNQTLAPWDKARERYFCNTKKAKGKRSNKSGTDSRRKANSAKSNHMVKLHDRL
jgi:type IV secretory pathway TraG/TraD family ATPase VirD4